MSLAAEDTTLPSLRGRFSLYLPRLKLRSRGGRVLFGAFVGSAAAGALPVAQAKSVVSLLVLEPSRMFFGSQLNILQGSGCRCC